MVTLRPDNEPHGDLFDGNRHVASLHHWRNPYPVQSPFEDWQVQSLIYAVDDVDVRDLEGRALFVVLNCDPDPWKLYGDGIVHLTGDQLDECLIEGTSKLLNTNSSPRSFPPLVPE